ncbi:CAP domain-containing protein [Croceivirga thetidis]|uniref:CAP domain-containing protein n=1 Tax=Croceivirga thetidis TaxID=2721623 RepID=A0ABX1GNA2_9FLAO|nr:CAP domain-containing protein [Croceivirga thetidis]NKI31411.1 CAP domain-containing protein [Croceivirga thetidis]
MKPNGLLLLFLVFLTVFTSCSKTELVEDEEIYETTALLTMSTSEEDLFNMVNTHRVEMGLNKLEFSSEAYKYAEEHNEYMIEQNKLSHDFFSSRASNLSNETGAVYVGENVAKEYNTNLGAFQGWYNSPPHRKTMEGEFTHAAVSIVVSPRGVPYFTQIFYRK